MPDFGIYAGDTNKTIYVRLRDSTTGLAKTGLVFNSAGAVCSYTLPLAARAAITLATQTVTGAHSDGGFVEVDATNCKGLYRLDLPDAAIASGDYTVISIEFDGIIEESLVIPLHTPDVNVTQWLGTAAATPSVAGVPEVDITHVAGATTNVSALATNADAIKTKTDFLPSATAGAAGGVFIAGTNAATTITTGLTTTFTGNLTGSVDSVTNAVGSVTGAVGSVTGAVGSVTAAVTLPTIPTNWVTADGLAADAVDEIWDETLTAHVTADSAAVHLKDIVADTNELQSDDVPGLIAALNDITTANVNTEVSDVLKTDTITLPGQLAPPATPTFEEAIAWLYKAFRNKKTQTATEWALYDDAGSTVDAKATVSDAASTATKGEIATGP